MKRSLVLLAIFTLLLVSSCNHKELDFGGVADLTVIFDWAGTRDANPSSMMLAAFAGSSQPVFKPLQGKDGGGIMLPEGDYQLIGYNEDTEVLYTKGDKWAGFEICSQPTEFELKSRMFARSRGVPRGAGTEDQQLIEEPDPLWTSIYEKATVTGAVGRKVTMEMEDATFVLNFTIKNVDNIEYITDILATVSGMSGSWIPSQHKCSDTDCLIPFQLSKGENTLSGSVRTFGYRRTGNNGEAKKHLLVVYTEMTDGSRRYYTFDVSEGVNKADPANGNKVEIVLEELPVPKPIENNSAGLLPDVVEWEEIVIPIKM
jgi:hypothetical protein